MSCSNIFTSATEKEKCSNDGFTVNNGVFANLTAYVSTFLQSFISFILLRQQFAASVMKLCRRTIFAVISLLSKKEIELNHELKG